MATRISKKDLEALVLKLNKLTNNPTTYMTDGKSNIGHYHVSCAYSGYAIHQLTSTGGAAHAIWGGYCPKRELYEKLNTFVNGIEYKQSLENPK